MIKRTLIAVVTTALIVGVVFAAGQGEDAREEPTLVTVVKSVAFNWFLRMETGVEQFGAEYAVRAYMEGPSVADSAQQIAIIENLIAQDVDAIINVPYGVEEHEPVQQKAMEAGIVVVTHEASSVRNADYDVEAFDNASYGEEMMRELADRMGAAGKYIMFVGSLTNASHNAWTDAARALQAREFGDLEFVQLYESKEDHEVAYTIMRDVLRTHPDIKGVYGCAAGDVVGAGRAIEEAGLSDRIAVVGTSIPSYAGELLASGAVDLAMAWDPATAGYAANVVARMVLTGEDIVDGMDLGVAGYESIQLTTNANGTPVIYGSAWIKIDADNMADYPF